MSKQPDTGQTDPDQTAILQSDALSADERFVRRAVDVLNTSMGGVPPAVTARLDSMREAAVASADDGFVNSPMLSRRSDPLPAAVTVRLDDIRARAIKRAAQQSQGLGRGALGALRERLARASFGIPAGAFASVCVLVTTLAVFSVPTTEEPIPAELAEDVLLLTSVDDIELYENLEFYQWLAENGL